MLADILEHSPVGRLTPILGPDPATREVVSGRAYLPNPLPARLVLTTETWTVVNSATAALARLDGAARLIPSPGLLRRPALRREAQSTSALEGTYAPFGEVLAADRDDPSSWSAEMTEILNFERMAELAFSWPSDRPITPTMLNELQSVLVRGTSGELSDTGRLRDRIVVIGKAGSSFADARYVPPPPGDQLRSGFEGLLAWMAAPPDLPAVVQAGMVHYQFETLHPYSDGNGRLGRLLVIVQLLRGAVIREPLLVISPWFEARREQYQDALLQLSCDGNWDAWLAFFAEGVAACAEESRQKVERLVELQANLRSRVQAARKRGSAEQVAADLVGEPYVTGPTVAKRYKLSWQGAANVIRTLANLEILEPSPLRTSRGTQLYEATDVMRVLFD